MAGQFRFKMAKQSGEALAKREGFTKLPIDPFVIARRHGIAVVAKPDAVGGVSGMLLRHGNAFGIYYATHVPSVGFQRFSVGHELGHFFLDGHIDQVLPGDGAHASRAGFVTADSYELEADQFAAGLLMPDVLVVKELRKRDIGLPAVEGLADSCQTSLTATAIRYAELSEHAVACVISTGPLIDFCFMSDRMKSRKEIAWLRKGTPVPTGTLTADINANSQRVASGARGAREVDLADWLGGAGRVVVVEEVIGLGNYGKTLTILSSSSLGMDDEREDDDEDEERLGESWTPRFRK